jgi:hypothetical protein
MCLPEPIEPFMPLSLKLTLAELRKDKILTTENDKYRTFCLLLKSLRQTKDRVEEILHKRLLGICRTEKHYIKKK